MVRGVRVANDRHRSGAALVLLIMLVCLLLSGCLRANVSMTFSENDRVSGEVLVAVRRPANQEPFRLRVPREFRERVHATPYSEGRMVGSTLSFDNLAFGEVEQLGRALGGSNSRYDFSIERTGSLIEVHGSIDLTPLDQTDSSVVVRINTVGEVTTTNGKNNSGTITWRPQPGEVTELSATFQYSDSRGGAWLNWTLMIAALTLGVAALVVKLALDSHRKSHSDAERVA